MPVAMNRPHSRNISVVLAGGDPGDPLAAEAGVASKALVPFAGRPLADYVVAALEASSWASEIIYVGPECPSLDARRLRAIPAGKDFTHSLALGLGAALAVAPDAPVLVVTGDLPWLTPEAVDRFTAAAAGAGFAIPLVPERAALDAFPHQRRTFVRLRQGRFTAGNLMLVEPGLVGSLLDLSDRVYRARKNPLALARLVGPGTVAALLLGRADLTRLERLASERLGGIARAVVSEDACLAADVDRGEHLSQPRQVGRAAEAVR
jgi:molybdopterin-guanine dinucleotide biosynthesis protein A